MNRCRVSFIASLLVLAPVIVAAQVVSSPSPIVSMTVGKVTALLDTSSGRFGVTHADGRTVLWRHPYNLTSHLSVSIDGRVWANYRWAILGRDVNVTNLGKGTAERLQDRLRYTWLLATRTGQYAVIEDLIPVSAPPWNEVRVRVRVENRTGAAAAVGVAVQMDVNAAGNDNAPLLLGTASCTAETLLADHAVPTRWSVAGGIFAPDTAVGRLAGEGVTPPDLFLAGQWRSHGALGMAAYGYRGLPGRPIDDAAVYLEWYAAAVPPAGARETGTALGFRAADPPPVPTSFGKRFIVRAEDVHGGEHRADCLLLVSAENTEVHLRYIDDRHINFAPRDTTITLLAGIPDTVCLTEYIWRPPDPMYWPDSLHCYQSMTIHLDGTRPFGAAKVDEQTDATLIWPAETAATEYILPGGLRTGECFVITMDSAAEIRVLPREFDLIRGLFDRNVLRETYTRGIRSSFRLPPRSWTHLHVPDTTWWRNTPRYAFDPRTSPRDYNGTVITADAPIQVIQHFAGGIPYDTTRYWDGGNLFTRHWGGVGFDGVPDERRLGTEYVFVPYEKRVALRYEDMLRIVAWHDSTRVFLGDSARQRLLHRGDRFDTLLAVPMVVTASKPVMAYQFAAFWDYTCPWDSAATAGVVALHPTELWGREYYGFADLITLPNHSTNHYVIAAHHRVRVYARAGESDTITLNGTPIPPALFRRIGNYAWYDMEMPQGPAVVRSPKPCLMLVYGWQRADFPFSGLIIQGVAYIPPFR
ncbi:MAG: IgGFc-binding protein [Ignavibacteriae bacterium]|nr:IgGFc-binding protein [Ignavibacteriota bacterium]